MSALAITASIAAGPAPVAAGAAPLEVGLITSATMTAGATLRSVVFLVSATSASAGVLSVTVPTVASGTPWPKPTLDPTIPGLLKVTKGSCTSVSLNPVKGKAEGPWQIRVAYDCPADGLFQVAYGATTPGALTIPNRPGAFTFTSRVNTGSGFVDVSAHPVVTVVAGPAASLKVQTRASTVIPEGQIPKQTLTVTALDAVGNVADSYDRTVALQYVLSDQASGGTQPATIVVTDGQGTLLWSPPVLPITAKLERTRVRATDGTLTSPYANVRVFEKAMPVTTYQRVVNNGVVGAKVGSVTITKIDITSIQQQVVNGVTTGLLVAIGTANPGRQSEQAVKITLATPIVPGPDAVLMAAELLKQAVKQGALSLTTYAKVGTATEGTGKEAVAMRMTMSASSPVLDAIRQAYEFSDALVGVEFRMLAISQAI